MSEYGFMGFCYKGQEKIAYARFGTPTSLGVKMLEWAREVAPWLGGPLVSYVKVVSEAAPPTDLQMANIWARLGKWGAPPTGRHEWHNILAETQGDPGLTLKVGYIEDASDFPHDSLFCEWGYMIDYDIGQFEVYRGLQKGPSLGGRFRPKEDFAGPYYPVRKIASFGIESLPNRETFLATVQRAASLGV